MKKSLRKLLSVIFIYSLSVQIVATETTSSTNSMIPLPLRINFNGMLMWGYNLDFDGHSMHHNHSSSNSHSMNNNSGMNNGHMGNNSNMGHNSDMNHSDMDENTHHSSMEMDQEWMFAVMPMISLGGDKFTNVINLNQSQSEGLTWETSSQNLVVAQNKVYKAGAGLGLMAMPPIDIPLFSLKLNMMPYKGGHIYKLKHIDSKKDKDLIEEMKIPKSLKELDSWRINDQLSYSTSGGVMFGAGAGMSILASAMKMYMAEGNWHTTIKKVDQTIVMASLRKSEIRMLSTNLSNMLVQISKGKMKNTDQFFNFVYDLEIEKGVDAYRRFLKGDILYTQELILSGSKAVELVKKSNSVIVGESTKFTAGVPFLFNSQNTKGEMINTSFIHNGYTNSKMKSYMGMYKKVHTTDGLLSNHKNGGVIFMGMSSEKENSEVFKPRFSGAFKWYYSKQDVKKKTLKKKLLKAAKVLGIDEIKGLNLPSINELGYLKVEMDLSLNKDEILTLLENKSLTADSEVESTIKKYFSSKKNLKDYCKIDTFLMTCKKRVISKTKKILKKIRPILEKMDESLNRKNLEEFNKNFTNLGKLALTNRFVLAEIMRSAGKKSLKSTLAIEGTNIQRYKNIIEGEL